MNAVLSENWVVYSYYNSASQRFEIAVLEFYDVRPRDLSIPSLLLGNQSSTLSAFAPPPIEVRPNSGNLVCASGTCAQLASMDMLQSF